MKKRRKRISRQARIQKSILIESKLGRIPSRDDRPRPAVRICKKCSKNEVTHHHWLCNKCWKENQENV